MLVPSLSGCKRRFRHYVSSLHTNGKRYQSLLVILHERLWSVRYRSPQKRQNPYAISTVEWEMFCVFGIGRFVLVVQVFLFARSKDAEPHRVEKTDGNRKGRGNQERMGSTTGYAKQEETLNAIHYEGSFME